MPSERNINSVQNPELYKNHTAPDYLNIKLNNRVKTTLVWDLNYQKPPQEFPIQR